MCLFLHLFPLCACAYAKRIQYFLFCCCCCKGIKSNSQFIVECVYVAHSPFHSQKSNHCTQRNWFLILEMNEAKKKNNDDFHHFVTKQTNNSWLDGFLFFFFFFWIDKQRNTRAVDFGNRSKFTHKEKTKLNTHTQTSRTVVSYELEKKKLNACKSQRISSVFTMFCVFPSVSRSSWLFSFCICHGIQHENRFWFVHSRWVFYLVSLQSNRTRVAKIYRFLSTQHPINSQQTH